MDRDKEPDYDIIERELLKIYAVADVIISCKEPCELERNTLPALGVIIQESVMKIRNFS